MVPVLPDRSGSPHRVPQREFSPYLGCFVEAYVVDQGSYGRADVAIFRRENQETKALNKALKERQATREKVHDVSVPREKRSFPDRKAFTWEKVNYVVPVPGGTRRLLHDIYGYIKPGTLTALMGASGAGKTSIVIQGLEGPPSCTRHVLPLLRQPFWHNAETMPTMQRSLAASFEIRSAGVAMTKTKRVGRDFELSQTNVDHCEGVRKARPMGDSGVLGERGQVRVFPSLV